MDYSKMSDQEINLAVARIIHPDLNPIESKARPPSVCFPDMHEWVDYCNHPANSWPIIVENKITVHAPMQHDEPQEWLAFDVHDSDTDFKDKNPLRAAMIVFLMMQESEKYAGAAKKCR